MVGGEVCRKSIQVVPRLLLALVERVVLGHGRDLHEGAWRDLAFDDVGQLLGSRRPLLEHVLVRPTQRVSQSHLHDGVALRVGAVANLRRDLGQEPPVDGRRGAVLPREAEIILP